MKITKNKLIDMVVPYQCIVRFAEQTNGTDEPVDVLSLLRGKNTIGDIAWIAAKTIPRERLIRFACDCAITNLQLIEPYILKYDEIKEFLQNPNDDTYVYGLDFELCIPGIDYTHSAEIAYNAAIAAFDEYDNHDARHIVAVVNSAAAAYRSDEVIWVRFEELFKEF